MEGFNFVIMGGYLLTNSKEISHIQKRHDSELDMVFW